MVIATTTTVAVAIIVVAVASIPSRPQRTVHTSREDGQAWNHANGFAGRCLTDLLLAADCSRDFCDNNNTKYIILVIIFLIDTILCRVLPRESREHPVAKKKIGHSSANPFEATQNTNQSASPGSNGTNGTSLWDTLGARILAGEKV